LKRIEEERQKEEKNKKKIKKKEKKIKQKQFKKIFLKNLLPESVISIGFRQNKEGKQFVNRMDTQVSNSFSDVERFYQENKIEVLNLIHSKNNDEMMESMRIYIERKGRPFNYYLENEENLHENREKVLKRKYEKSEDEMKRKERQEKEIKEKENKDYWDRMEKRINDIKRDEEEIINNNDKTRKFLLLNIMPILTKGLLEICKVDPVDPVDYLADYLFMNSTA
jgi:adenylate kinase